jgi:phosphocarrier protein HPr
MTQRATAKACLPNERGLHARPCSALSRPCSALCALALKHKASVRVRCNGNEADGRSILSLMMLGAAHGSELEFEAEGEDAPQLVDSLVALVRAGFSETN